MSTAPQFLAPAVLPEEDDLEKSLRPRRLSEFVGQERIKEQLSISLDATKGRDEALDHVLLVGPPGLGKTSLAYIVREELGVGIRCVAGPALERKGDMAAILTALEPRDVLLVGATTRTGLLTTPLRDRFGMTFRLEYYEPAELGVIVRRSAGILGVEIAEEAADQIAGQSRGTPRVANRILR